MIGDGGLIRGLADSAALSCSLEAPDCFPRNFIVIDIAIISNYFNLIKSGMITPITWMTFLTSSQSESSLRLLARTTRRCSAS